MTPELAIVGLLLLALGKGGASKKPDASPSPGDAGGSGSLDASKVIGGIAGAATTAIGAVKSIAAGIASLGGTAQVTSGAAATGGIGTAAVGETVVLSLQTGFTAGAGFTIGWTFYFFLQFLLYNVINRAQTDFKDGIEAVAALNSFPLRELHSFERDLMRTTLQAMKIPYTETEYPDARLNWRQSTGNLLTTSYSSDETRVVIIPDLSAQNFGLTDPQAILARRTQWWTQLSYACRAVAFTYAEKLGFYARSVLRTKYGRGGVTASNDTWGVPFSDVWAFPMISGQYPAIPRSEAEAQLVVLGADASSALRAAQLQAIYQVLFVTASRDSGTYAAGFDYASDLWTKVFAFTVIGLGAPHCAVSGRWFVFEPATWFPGAKTVMVDIDAIRASANGMQVSQ